MPIEVRELQIRSRVDGSAHPASARSGADELETLQLERLRETLLAECKALIATTLRERQER